MGLFSSTSPSGNSLSVKLVTFWFFLWSLLIPVLLMVLALMGFLLWSKFTFFVSGMEYPLGELFLVLAPLLALGLMVKDSLSLLYLSSQSVGAELTLKVIGSQWYWNYELSDLEDAFFSSYMKSFDDLSVGDTRFLEVDNRLVLPVNLAIQANITSSDVIHSFALPTLGVKADATAGILNVVTFEMLKVGTHFGQCSEICGLNHSYMPIGVESTLFINFYYWNLLFL